MPAHAQQVVGAAHVPVVAVRVLAILVSGVVPLALQNPLRRFLPPPVACEHAPAADEQVSDLSGGHVGAAVINQADPVPGYGATRASRARFTDAVADEDMQSLRRADAIQDFDAEALAPAAVQVGGQGLRGREAHA